MQQGAILALNAGSIWSSPTVQNFLARIENFEHNQGVDPFQLPTNEEISAAYALGEAEVLALFQQTVEQLAARVQSLEDLLSKSDQASPVEIKTAGEVQLAIRQGDIFWVPLEEPDGSDPGYPHPYVVVQDNLFNHSRIRTVMVCALTTNRKRANLPGNVTLEAGEANLPRHSVVEVSKIAAVDKSQLGKYIGSLSQERVEQILAGMRFLRTFTEPRCSNQG
jgi:mRNA interferase MazF